MKTFYSNENLEKKFINTGVGLGNFDGLHKGHMFLTNTLIEKSKEMGLTSMIYTFRCHPDNILLGINNSPLITSIMQKVALLEKTDLNNLYFEEFTSDYSHIEAETFIKKVLVDRLQARLVVAGFDYRFGYKGYGDTELLIKMGEKYNYETIIIPPVKEKGEVISSTLIRKLISEGKMENVVDFLGRNYSMGGEVQIGRKVGRTIGFPTANLIPEDYMVSPLEGVYATKTDVEGKIFMSLTNVGYNPTFDDSIGKTVETYIMDFDGELYGKHIEVFFMHRLRPEIKFSSKDELIQKINMDIEATRVYFKKNSI
jgi:riboflavin kinase/FMN adenylyltransferase